MASSRPRGSDHITTIASSGDGFKSKAQPTRRGTAKMEKQSIGELRDWLHSHRDELVNRVPKLKALEAARSLNATPTFGRSFCTRKGTHLR
jgi:hypothetical protein